METIPNEEITNAILENSFDYNIIDLNKIESNSVIILKVSPENPDYAVQLQHGFIKNIFEPNIQLLKEKNISVIFMSRDDSLELISEKDMEKSGWIRKPTNNLTDDKPNKS